MFVQGGQIQREPQRALYEYSHEFCQLRHVRKLLRVGVGWGKTIGKEWDKLFLKIMESQE